MDRTNPSRSHAPSSGSSERFRVMRELGRGGKGVVLLVYDRLRGEPVALKRLRRSTALDVRQLKREYRAIERIAHAGIVTVYELGFDAQGPYILMEPVYGTNLFEFCRPGALGPVSGGASFPAAAGEREPLRGARSTRSSAREVAAETTLNLTLSLGEQPPHAGLVGRASAQLATDGFARLYRALPQLLSALDCLHQSGLVHRDLKPANVLVREDQALKLLDLGILGETGSDTVATLQGTAAYVAPEQIRGEPPSASNDLYALGVLLFEIVAGHLPFVGPTRSDLLLQHLHAPAIDVRELSPDCPIWLAELIAGLLRKEPAQRYDLRATRELCARALGSYAERTAPAISDHLLERAEEQTILLDLLDDSAATTFKFITISGASGLGKSALLAWTRAAIRRRQLTFFESRARFSELVPFNTIDGLIDALASMLERFPELVSDDEGQRLRDVSSAAFSALTRPIAANERPRKFDRKVVFDALITLLQRCTRITGRLLLLCDDLQWSDADSISLLERLLSTAPAGLMLIATVRDDAHSEAFAKRLPRLSADVTLKLQPLSEDALATIIRAVARDAGRPIDALVARRVAKVCDGRPLLAVVSGRVAGSQEFDAASEPLAFLLENYAARGAQERLLLSLLVAIDNDALLPRLARISASSSGAVEKVLSPLLREGLITVSGRFGEQRSYDFSHDLIRTHTAAVLEAEEIRLAHARVADDAELVGDVPAALRVRHLLGAGRFATAAEVAAIGARDAERANASGLAVDLYGIAITHGAASPAALREARAVALERSGRYIEAAAEWGSLAERRAGDSRVDALLQQAKAVLAAGEIGQGRTILRQARSERRERDIVPELVSNLIALGRFKVGPRVLPGGLSIAKLVPSTAMDERDVFLGTMIGYFDPPGGSAICCVPATTIEGWETGFRPPK